MMRADLDTVASLVPRGSRVLDLGCGHGALLEHLIRERGCDGRGIDSSAEGFLACVRRGVTDKGTLASPWDYLVAGQ